MVTINNRGISFANPRQVVRPNTGVSSQLTGNIFGQVPITGLTTPFGGQSFANPYATQRNMAAVSPQLGGIMGSTMRAPTPPTAGGFGSRIRDVFQDQSRFADALAGIAGLTGSTAADTLGIRSALAPETTKARGFGKLYDIVDNDTGQVIGQVSDEDTAEINRVYNDPKLTLREQDPAAQIGDVPKGYRLVTGDDGVQRLEFIRGFDEDATLEKIRQTQSLIRLSAQTHSRIKNALNNILDYVKLPTTSKEDKIVVFDPTADGAFENLARSLVSSEEALLARQAFKFIRSNLFITAINNMRAASKTGGAVGSVTEREMDTLRDSQAELTPAANAFRSQVQKFLTEAIDSEEQIQKFAQQDLELYRRRVTPETEQAIFGGEQEQQQETDLVG